MRPAQVTGRLMSITMFLRSWYFPVLLLILPLPGWAQLSGVAPATVIRAGRLLDVDSGRLLSDQVILVRDCRIEAVGKNLRAPDGAGVIDLSKMTVLPVLVDCHTHLADLADSEPLNLL